MARIRKFAAYQNLERPYTRISKFNKKNFVRGGFPHLKITKFTMGNVSKQYDTLLTLHSLRAMNIRHNALEAARMTSNRVLEKALGKDYFLRVKVYPFHVLRENPLASCAGADRMSTGMQKPFGKPISSAARVRENQIIMELKVNQNQLKLAKEAMTRAAKKLPCPCKIVIGQ